MATNRPPKAHHIIPACYLKNFASPKTREGVLHVLDRETGRWRPSKPSVECKENDYNTVDGDCEPHAYEEFLGKIENDCSPILDEVIASGQLPVGDESFDKLLTFLALVHARTKTFRDRIYDATVQFFRTGIDKATATPKDFDDLLSKIDTTDIEFNEEVTKEAVRERMRQEVGQVEAEIHNNFYLDQMSKLIEEVLPIYHSKTWRIVKSSPGQHFITSDTPINFVLRSNDGIDKRENSNLVLAAPLSSDTAIVGCEASDPTPHRDDWFVFWLNALIVTRTRRFIYASTPEFQFGHQKMGVVRSRQLVPGREMNGKTNGQ